MKKYSVKLFYHLCLDFDVKASSEQEALEKAQSMAESLSAEEFIESVQEDGNEVEELN